MLLKALPKTFGLTELKKGYFSQFFNQKENQTYVGPLPPVDNMDTKEDNSTNFHFHFQSPSRRPSLIPSITIAGFDNNSFLATCTKVALRLEASGLLVTW